jgi:hypothetical protein
VLPSQQLPKNLLAFDTVFHGKVVREKASNIAALPPQQNTVIVKVLEIVQAPTTFRLFSGRDVTVQLVHIRLRRDQEAIFFASSLFFSESVAVKEEAIAIVDERNPLAPLLRSLPREIERERLESEKKALVARVASSDGVILGRVETIPPPRPERELGYSEHDPMFRVATIDIACVYAGKTLPPKARVFYAESEDALWKTSPKLSRIGEGVFLLHRVEGGPAAYAVLDSADFVTRKRFEELTGLECPLTAR